MAYLRSLGLTRAMLSLLRRVLYLFIRTRTSPETGSTLSLNPALPVCYVLQQRHISNLLVLEQESARLGLPRPLHALKSDSVKSPRAYFFLSRSGSLIAPASSAPPSRLMSRLVDAVLEHADFDIQIVPVTILWGLAPSRQDSILKALFSEAWHNTSTLRQLFAILIHGRQTVVRFNAPFSLRELVDDEHDSERARHKLARVLRVHFRREREHAIGPDLSHRYNLIRALLATPTVRAAILAEANDKSLPLPNVEDHAWKLALEIVSDYSYSVVRALELLLDWIWHRVFDGIEIRGFENVHGIAPGTGIVYVPCHRSHVDYLLLSFIIFRAGLRPPHIAAGANLNIPVVGPILRRGGAFFLRRSLKGEALYTAIFTEYLQGMSERGFPVEYFVEGGRSRNGRTLPPKAGILGMTVRGFINRPERPLVFVPVYIGYEKVMEGRTYLAELQGKRKRAESLLGVISAIRNLRRAFGKVYVNFGQPMSLPDHLDQRYPHWRSDKPEPEAWLRTAVEDTANELARRINAIAVVGPVNLFALALLATPRDVADRSALERLIAHLHAILGSGPCGALAETSVSPRDIVDRAMQLGYAELVGHPLGDLVRANPDQAGLLSYCRNNVMHLLAIPALIACLLHHNQVLSENRAVATIREVYPLLRAELFLSREDADLEAAVRDTAQVLMQRGLLRIDADTRLWHAPAATTEASEQLGQLGEMIRPLLQRLFIVLSLLEHHGPGMLDREQLQGAAQLLAQRLRLLNQDSNPEASEKAQFAQLVRTLIDAGMLSVGESGRLGFDQRISAPATQAELLLAANLRDTIRRAARSGAVPATTSDSAPTST